MGFGGALVMGACSGTGGYGRLDAQAPERLVGEVGLSGSVPSVMVTLRTADGQSVSLVGELRDELAQLTGAVVAVQGVPTATPREFTVESYEIQSIEGERPMVGILILLDGVIWLQPEGGEAVRLVEIPERLREKVGAKIWILGRPADGGTYPHTYGIIRDVGGE
jgi:hypothetical protein